MVSTLPGVLNKKETQVQVQELGLWSSVSEHPLISCSQSHLPRTQSIVSGSMDARYLASSRCGQGSYTSGAAGILTLVISTYLLPSSKGSSGRAKRWAGEN